jgi:hypothetical protein
MGIKPLRSQTVTFGKYVVPLSLIDLFRLSEEEGFTAQDFRIHVRTVKECLKNELIVHRI